MKKILILLTVLIIGYAAVFALSRSLEKNQPPVDEKSADEDLYFSANNLESAGHDFRGLIADWYWINSLQYIGKKTLKEGETVNINDLRSLNPRLLYPMLDTATTLDPQFMAVYSYGASVLPAIDNALAVKLLEKGIASNPNDWKLYHNLGYIYWQTKNYAKAAELYAEGSTKPNAPSWLKMMSAKMQTQGGSREFAIETYRQMAETAEDEQTRNFAGLRLMQAESLNEQEAVNKLLADLKQKNGHCVKSLAEILPQLKTVNLPDKQEFHLDKTNNLTDPSGVPYLLDAANCRMTLNPQISKIPLN